MMKWLLSAMLLVIGYPIFSDEFQHPLQDWQNESLLHYGYGNAHLVSNEPWQALEHFQKAASCLVKSDSSSCPIGFLITFSQVIAYDCLGFHDQCKQAMGSLFLTINEYDEEEDRSPESNEPMRANNEESKIAVEFLQHLATIAPSPAVRELLFSLTEDMAEELLPTFEFADQPLLGNLQFGFDYSQNHYSVDFCKHKSFWKKFRGWCAEIADWINDAVRIFKGAKDIKETYNQWKKENQQNNLDFEQFKSYYNQRYKNH